MLQETGWTIRDRYKQRVRESSTVPFQFNIMTDSRFVCLLCYNFVLFRLYRYLVSRVLSIPLELFGLCACFFGYC
jgi:hypothetical protein